MFYFWRKVSEIGTVWKSVPIESMEPQSTHWRRQNKLFHSLMRDDALQTFKNITILNRENLRKILSVFLRKYAKPQSMATTKRKFQQLVSNPANQNFIDFLDELQKLAQATIDQFIYAKIPPTWRNRTFRPIWRMAQMNIMCLILKRRWNWRVWKFQMSCRSTLWRNKPHNEIQQNPNQFVTTGKNQVSTEIRAENSNERKSRPKTTRLLLARTTTTLTVFKQTLTPTGRFPTKPTKTIQITEMTENHDLYTHSLRPMVKLNSPRESLFWANAANRPPPRNRLPEGQNQVQQINAQNNPEVNVHAGAQT